ncbi:hypothetical protein L7F22_056851 [Adiantum nelumboides]|nr:hypothetical protein [Adiantum nelumboides]
MNAHKETKATTKKESKPSKQTTNGLENIWSSARARVPGCSGTSNLGTDMINKHLEERKPLKYIEPKKNSWNERRPSRKCNISSSHQSEGKAKFLGKKVFSSIGDRENVHGPLATKYQWNTPFQKGIANNQFLSDKHGKKRLGTYPNQQDSRGVKESFDPSLQLPPRGKKSLPTYRNEFSSKGVATALNRLL